MIHTITYCDSKFSTRTTGIVENLKSISFIDTYKCHNKTDLSEKFVQNFPSGYFSSRGGGWWVWKPYIIKQSLANLGPEDVLVYLDGGSTVNDTVESRRRFEQYVEMIDSSTSKMLVFESCKKEKDYTNLYCISNLKDKFNISESQIDVYINSRQIMAGITVMKRSDFTTKFCDMWLKLAMQDNGVLFTDKHTRPGEIHRHDQSHFSMLYKIQQGDLVISNETWFGRGGFGGEKSKKYPIWSTRMRT